MNCYICGDPSTSDEHAPARSFFPKGKRNQLITVRSCAKHNEDTSKDDEYVRNLIVMSLGNNSVALDHFNDKGIGSFNHSTALLVELLALKKRFMFRKTMTSRHPPMLLRLIENVLTLFYLRSHMRYFFGSIKRHGIDRLMSQPNFCLPKIRIQMIY